MNLQAQALKIHSSVYKAAKAERPHESSIIADTLAELDPEDVAELVFRLAWTGGAYAVALGDEQRRQVLGFLTAVALEQEVVR